MSDKLGLGALSDALGDKYTYEHDTERGHLIVRRGGLFVSFSDVTPLAVAVKVARAALAPAVIAQAAAQN